MIVTYGTPPSEAAKQATAVIPIVFAAAADPVGSGLVASLARPGGNITGLSLQQSDIVGKKLELLREALTGLRRLAIMGNAGDPASALEIAEVRRTAIRLGLEVVSLTSIERRTSRRHLKQPTDALTRCMSLPIR